MTVSSYELAVLAEEVSARLAGRRTAKIYQLGRYEILFLFREEKSLRLFISVDPRFGRMHLTEKKIATPTSPTPLAQLLRKHLSGRMFGAVVKRPNDRLVALKFSDGYSFYCRMYGGGGFLLADSEATILSVSDFAEKPPLKIGARFELSAHTGAREEQKAEFLDSPSMEIERSYETLIAKATFEEEKRRLLSAARKELKKCAKLITALSADMDKLLKQRNCREMGDLCRTFFNEIPRGAKSIRLKKPETGQELEITLKPELSPSENIAFLYKKYKKYKSGIGKVEESLKNARYKEARIAGEIAEMEKAEKSADLAPFKDFSAVSGAKKKAVTRQKKRLEKKRPSSACRLFTSIDGLEIRIGRNNLQNDDLVRSSNGNDLWFHVRDFPGPHVVVRAGRKGDVPQTTIMEAAKLALKYSTRAKDKKGIVVYAHVKNLKKPKKAPPGKVTVTREKTIHVRLS